MKFKCLAFVIFLLSTAQGYAQQQEAEFQLTVRAPLGKKVFEVKRGPDDVYLCVLDQTDKQTPLLYNYSPADSYSAQFSAYGNFQIADIVAFDVGGVNPSASVPFIGGNCITLQVTPNDRGHHFHWYFNGTVTADTGSVLQATKAGVYDVEVSGATVSRVKSQKFHLIFLKLPPPYINTDKDYYCHDETATLSVEVPGYSGYGINWYLNGFQLNNLTNRSSFSTTTGGDYVVSVFDPSSPGDPTMSEERILVFDPPPAINILPVANNPVCNGETVILQAMHDAGTLLWSTGETTDHIAVTTSGNYTVTITTPHGCVNNTGVDIHFLPSPTVAVKDTFFCLHTKQSVFLHAPPGFSQYIWNGRPGGQTYFVGLPQTVTLTVVSENNCTATQQIQVADVCSVVYIPNTFTPNGDGINDNWAVEGLGDDKTILVSVFTRSGMLVYQSHGYNTNWNGEYNGKRLPAGVYYYAITAKNGAEKYGGSLTILY